MWAWRRQDGGDRSGAVPEGAGDVLLCQHIEVPECRCRLAALCIHLLRTLQRFRH